MQIHPLVYLFRLHYSNQFIQKIAYVICIIRSTNGIDPFHCFLEMGCASRIITFFDCLSLPLIPIQKMEYLSDCYQYPNYYWFNLIFIQIQMSPYYFDKNLYKCHSLSWNKSNINGIILLKFFWNDFRMYWCICQPCLFFLI